MVLLWKLRWWKLDSASLLSIVLCNALWHKVSQSSNIQDGAPGRRSDRPCRSLILYFKVSFTSYNASQVLQEIVGVHLLLLYTDTFTFALLWINVNKCLSKKRKPKACHKAWYNARKFSWKQTKNQVFSKPFSRPAANLEGDKVLVLQLSSLLKTLKNTFLSCPMGDGLIHSLLARSISQAIPLALQLCRSKKILQRICEKALLL